MAKSDSMDSKVEVILHGVKNKAKKYFLSGNYSNPFSKEEGNIEKGMSEVFDRELEELKKARDKVKMGYCPTCGRYVPLSCLERERDG